MSAIAAAAGVNAWDLCHHLVTQAFGVAGVSATEPAEPDLEQPGIKEYPSSTLWQPCEPVTDRPGHPSSHRPGYFGFRDSSHSQLEAARAAVGWPQIEFAPPIFTSVGRCGERAV